MEPSLSSFQDFLESQKLILDSKYVRKDSLKEFILSYFHLFQEETLRTMITFAMNSQKPGSQKLSDAWSSVLDALKIIIEERKALATQNIQNLIGTGMRGDNRGVDRIIITLLKEKQVDYLLMGILTETLNACEGKREYEEQFYMLTYMFDTIQKIMARSEAYKPIVKDKLASQETGSSFEDVTGKIQAVSVENSAVKPAAPSSSSVVPPPAPIVNADMPAEKQAEYIACSTEINGMIQSAKGDMGVLKGLLHAYLVVLADEHIESVVLQVIQDNILACQTHGYVNKEKLLSYMKSMIESYLASKVNNENVNTINSSTYHAPQFLDASRQHDNSYVFPLSNVISATSISNIQHQLTTSSQMNNKKKRKEVQRQLNQLYASLVQQIADSLVSHHYVVIENFIHIQLVQRVHIEASKLAKFYEESEIWVGKGADVGAHLSVPNIRGDKVLWLCGGHQLMKLAPNQKKKPAAAGKAPGAEQEEEKEEESSALMPLNNSEVKLFEPAAAARKSEEEEVMRSTNHMAVEGNGRAITTYGEIEPCKLTIKTQSPVKRFMALKDLILQCDTMISYLRGTHPLFENIYERSDVMLAIYPGNGARFANHIDNTTQDGRRLTLVVYLNENWQEDMGGALRVTEPAIKPQIASEYSSPVSPAHASKGSAADGNKQLDVGTLPASSSGSPSGMSFDVYPIAGRVAMFFSSSIAHEVLPTYGSRYALTIWYYDKDERKQAIQNANEKGTVHKVSHYDVKYQVEAKEFIGRLLKNHDKELEAVHQDGDVTRYGEEEEPTEEELKSLCHEVQNTLTKEAIEIVASITGAPSVDSFKAGFPLLTTKDLQHMRALFRRMGLQ
eukprot:gene35892-43533_t